MKKNKIYFSSEHFEEAIRDFKKKFSYIPENNFHFVTLYRGGLPLGVRLSNEYDAPLSIIDYQRYSGKSESISIIKDAGIKDARTIILVDDIADEGNTLTKSILYIEKIFNKKPLVYTLYGNALKHPNTWNYTFKHNSEWVQFIPWEGL